VAVQEDRTFGYELLQQLVGIEIEVVETDSGDDDDHSFERIELRVSEKDVEMSAFGIIFAIGVLSFHDARPRGASEIDYQEKDDWTVADMLRRLRYERGELRFFADYVRGRMMKTSVAVGADGTVRVATTNRGPLASRWIRQIQGKKYIWLATKDGMSVEKSES
jgi:hypothetical protein